MKSLVLFLFLFCSINISAQKWCSPGAEWIYKAWGLIGEGVRIVTYEKDSLILNHTCQILKVKNIASWGSNKIEKIWTYSTIDTVFIYQSQFQEFKPLYMFNVEVGDTIEFGTNITWSCSFTKVVTAKGNLILNGDTLRYYDVMLMDYNDEYINPIFLKIVERFGALGAFMNPLYNCFTDPVFYDLACYHDDIFGDKSFYNKELCEVSSSINILKDYNFEIYPNPATKEISLVNAGDEKVNMIEISDIKGSKLISKRSYDNTINVADLSPGIYIIKIGTVDEKVGYKKFIKH